MKAYNIAVIAGKMNGAGVEEMIVSFMKHVDSSRIKMTFFVDEDSKFIPWEKIERYHGNIEIIPKYQKPLTYHKAVLAKLKEKQYDAVHAHINTLSFFPLFAAKRAKVAVRIVHAHNTTGKEEWKRKLLKYMLRPLTKAIATDRCACSEYAGEWMYGKHSTFTVMPNAAYLDLKSFQYNPIIRQQVRKELKLGNELVIGHVGRFMKQKNHHFLLEVFALIQRSVPNAKLLLVGTGELMQTVRQRVSERGIADSVLFMGQQTDVSKYYQAMDIMLFPSIYEGMPLVPTEAQAAGLPVVMSDVITKEVVLRPELVHFLSLDQSPQVWAEETIKAFQTKVERQMDNSDLYVVPRDAKNQYVLPNELLNWYCALIEKNRVKYGGGGGYNNELVVILLLPARTQLSDTCATNQRMVA